MSSHRPPLQARIADDLRARILDGRLAPGTRVPSSRAYAETRGVSRTTVVLAYEQLLAEGFLEGRRGSGTFVAHDLRRELRKGAVDAQKPIRMRLSSFARDVRSEARRRRPTATPAEPLRWDFRYGRAELGFFPRTSWRRSLAKAAKTEERGTGDYVSALGTRELRRAIAGYLDRARGLSCDPDHICVTTGSQQALYLCARLLCDAGDTVLVEEPHYAGARQAFQLAGACVRPVETDASGLNTDALPRTARAVYVTPSHQFPLGGVLPLGRRQALLRWARRQKVAVIEDDYDGEYRFGTQPVPPLRSMEGAESVRAKAIRRAPYCPPGGTGSELRRRRPAGRLGGRAPSLRRVPQHAVGCARRGDRPGARSGRRRILRRSLLHAPAPKRRTRARLRRAHAEGHPQRCACTRERDGIVRYALSMLVARTLNRALVRPGATEPNRQRALTGVPSH